MSSVLARYEELIAAGELRPDVEQRAAAVRLAQLQNDLESPHTTGFLSKLFGKKPTTARGLYLWGGVGRGKSMLMDLFHDSLAIPDKRRVHFHAFMQEVHARLREARKSESGDPIPPVAAATAVIRPVNAKDDSSCALS